VISEYTNAAATCEAAWPANFLITMQFMGHEVEKCHALDSGYASSLGARNWGCLW
jgi:hypothetical protein